MLLESLFTSCLSAYKVTVAVSCLFLKPFSELAYASTQSSIFTFLWMHIRRKTFLPDHRMILRSWTHYLKESALWDIKHRMKNIHWGQTKDIIFTELIVLGKSTSHILQHFTFQQHNTVQNNIRLKHSRRLHIHFS